MSYNDSLFVEVLKSCIYIVFYMYMFYWFVYRAYFGFGEKGREFEFW